jgi:hypothetical protein
MRHVQVSLLIAATILSATTTFAHDSWISQGRHKNAAGEWCCGAGDCFAIPPDQVSMLRDSYRIYGVELIPYQEAQPSPDGTFWRCKRPDGSRRCFFAPPPGS